MGIGEASGMFPYDDEAKDFDAARIARFDALVEKYDFPWKLKDIFPQVLPAGAQGGTLSEAGAALLDESGQLQLTPDGNVFTTGNDGVSRPSAPVLDAVSKFLKDKYGYDTGAYTGYNTKAPSLKLLARIDWNINADHKLMLRYNDVKNSVMSLPNANSCPPGLPRDKTVSRVGPQSIAFSKNFCTFS